MGMSNGTKIWSEFNWFTNVFTHKIRQVCCSLSENFLKCIPKEKVLLDGGLVSNVQCPAVISFFSTFLLTIFRVVNKVNSKWLLRESEWLLGDSGGPLEAQVSLSRQRMSRKMLNWPLGESGVSYLFQDEL